MKLSDALSYRWTLAYTGFLGVLISNSLWMNMSVAILCMVVPSNMTGDTNSTCQSNAVNSPQAGGYINWDKTTQGFILSAYFYGFVVSQLPGGYIAGRFGGKRVVLVGMFLQGICSLLIPVAARYHDGDDYTVSAWLVMTLRIIDGFAAGLIYPALQTLCGRWALPYERSSMFGMIMAGGPGGSVTMLATAGSFCMWTSAGGWSSMFYTFGTASLLFCILWMFVIYESPADHPRITEEEKHLILDNLGLGSEPARMNTRVPWKKILTSVPVWATIINGTCFFFVKFSVATELPRFLNEIMAYDIQSTGAVATAPYIVKFLISILASRVIDLIRRKELLSTAISRKVATFLGMAVPAALFAVIGNMSCIYRNGAVVLVSIAVGLSGFCISGFHVNPQDLAPRYAGEIYSIVNVFSGLAGIAAPPLIHYITKDETRAGWEIVFYMWMGVLIFGTIIYLLFLSGSIQPWANPSKEGKLESGSDDDSNNSSTTSSHQTSLEQEKQPLLGTLLLFPLKKR